LSCDMKVHLAAVAFSYVLENYSFVCTQQDHSSPFPVSTFPHLVVICVPNGTTFPSVDCVMLSPLLVTMDVLLVACSFLFTCFGELITLCAAMATPSQLYVSALHGLDSTYVPSGTTFTSVDCVMLSPLVSLCLLHS
jgi:hypothetical protein